MSFVGEVAPQVFSAGLLESSGFPCSAFFAFAAKSWRTRLQPVRRTIQRLRMLYLIRNCVHDCQDVFVQSLVVLGESSPCVSVLGFLVDSHHDMSNLMIQYSDNSGAREVACTLWSRAQRLAANVCKRRARVDPAWQRVLLAKSSPLTSLAAGARRSKRMQKALRCTQGQSREDIDKQRLARGRRELVEIIIEAKLPIVANAQLAFCPQPVIEAS